MEEDDGRRAEDRGEDQTQQAGSVNQCAAEDGNGQTAEDGRGRQPGVPTDGSAQIQRGDAEEMHR